MRLGHITAHAERCQLTLKCFPEILTKDPSGPRHEALNGMDEAFDDDAGGHREVEIPVPIPNTEVKHPCADDTATSGKVGDCRLFFVHRTSAGPRPRIFFCLHAGWDAGRCRKREIECDQGGARKDCRLFYFKLNRIMQAADVCSAALFVSAVWGHGMLPAPGN